MPLSERRQKFVECYLVTLNAAEAAREAGYSEKNAKKEGHRLLQIDEVADAIAAAKAERKARVEVFQDDVLRELLCILRVDIGRAFRPDGTMLPLQPLKVQDEKGVETIEVMPEDVRRAIAGVDVERLYEGRGDERHQVGTLTKIRLLDKTRAVELGMRHLGLMKDTKVKFEGNLKVKAAAGVMLLPAEEIDLPPATPPAPSNEGAKPEVEQHP
jgi:phage terminase small subunit